MAATLGGRKSVQPPKELGGYECEFVQRPPDMIQTECSICLQVLKEPHIISCCGHSFCKSCIKRVEKDEKSCPLCNEEEFTLMHNKGMERSMKELEVYCTHRKVGCGWVGKLGVLDQHLNIDPAPEGCGFVQIKCGHVDCGQFIQRRFLGNHQANECPKRPFSCDYCREYKSTFEDVANNHYPVCKCYPLSCPNNCAPDTIASQDLQRHLDEDCPLQVVHCDFQYAGCKAKLPRKDIPAHLAESYTHITLMAILNQRLAQTNDEMAAKLLEKEEQIERLTEDFRNEMEIKHTEVDELKRLTNSLAVQFGRFKQQNEALKGEVNRLKKNAVAKTDFTKLKEEVQFKKGTVHKSEFNKLKQDTISHAEFDEIQSEFDRWKHIVVSQTLDTEMIHHHIHVAPVQITMTSFQQHKRASDTWFSDPFYTRPHGYKMCLRVDANGNGCGEGTHISTYVYMMRGEFDNHLEWPFRGNIIVQLLNHLGDRVHHTDTIALEPETGACLDRVTRGERADHAKGRGHEQFIAHNELNYSRGRNCQYLKNDYLMFRVDFETPL